MRPFNIISITIYILCLITSIVFSQTNSSDNLSLTLDKKHQSIDTTKYINPKLNNIMYQVTILKHGESKLKDSHGNHVKYFQVQLINISHPSNSIKISAFEGYELYNNLFNLCTAIYGYNPDNWLGTIDEEIFVVRGEVTTKEGVIYTLKNTNNYKYVNYWEIVIIGPMYYGSFRKPMNTNIPDFIEEIHREQQAVITEVRIKPVFTIK